MGNCIAHFSENIIDLDDVEIDNFAEKLTNRPLFKKSSRAKRASHHDSLMFVGSR